ncbi:Arm domain-containing protein, partial [Cephalotus follicularis]
MEVKRRTTRTLVAKLSSVSEQTRAEALCELRLLTKHDADSRSLLAETGAIPYLAEILYSSSHDSQENATATLLNLSISSREALMSTRGLLDALSHALRHHSSTTSPLAVQSSAATLHSLLIDESYRPIIGSKRDIIYSLIEITKCPNSPPRSIKDSLKALFGISLYPLNRNTMIELGAVAPLFSLVVKDGRVGIVEDATAVIAQVAGCEESEEAFMRVSGIGVLVDLLDMGTGSSERVKENAVAALLNLVRTGSERVAREVRDMGAGVVDGIADVAENGSAKGKSKALALLKVVVDDKDSRGYISYIRPKRYDGVEMTQPTLMSPIPPTGNPYRDMVMDAGGFEYDWDANPTDEGFQMANANAKKFYDLLNDANEPLWHGCKKSQGSDDASRSTSGVGRSTSTLMGCHSDAGSAFPVVPMIALDPPLTAGLSTVVPSTPTSVAPSSSRPPRGGMGTKLFDHVSDKNAMETDSSTPALCSDKEKFRSQNLKTKMEKRKKRKREEWEIADSIRWLAEVLLRSEQTRMETMKEIEKMRAEAEAKRGEMDLKRIEIIAKTQLEIAKLFAGANKGVDPSLRIGRS